MNSGLLVIVFFPSSTPTTFQFNQSFINSFCFFIIIYNSHYCFNILVLFVLAPFIQAFIGGGCAWGPHWKWMRESVWIQLRNEWEWMKRNEQINERQWNGINQRRTKGANRPRQANNSTILLLCWLALWGQAKNGWIGRVGGGRWFSLSLLLVMGQRPLYRGRTHSKRNETSLSVWPPCFPSLQSSN